MDSFKYLFAASCIVLCTAQPVAKLPVLKDQPAEVLFKDSTPGVLECIIEGGQGNVKYTWYKNGEAFTPSADITQRKNEGTLEFRKPKPSDEGQYQCFAETEHGVASSRIISYKRAFIITPKLATQRHIPTEGRPFKLDCKAPKSYPKATISWKTQQDGSSDLEPYLNRRITPSPDGTLWFSNVTREDVNPKSKYVCVASISGFEDVVLAAHYIDDLKVDSEPNNGDLIPQYLSNDIMAKAGDVTMIWCIYGGTPLAHPDWFKNGKNVNGKPSDRITRHNRTSGRRLLIKETLLEDEGTYKCVANNEVGKPQEHSIKLTVVSAPLFVKKPEKQTTVRLGQNVIIPCQVEGVPTPKVTYTLNGKPLNAGDRVIINPEGITINDIKASDTGYYGCRAQNPHGDEYAESLLVVA